MLKKKWWRRLFEKHLPVEEVDLTEPQNRRFLRKTSKKMKISKVITPMVKVNMDTGDLENL